VRRRFHLSSSLLHSDADPAWSRRRSRSRAIPAVALAAIAILSFVLRFACEPELREGFPRRFVSPDCLYHMRRATFAVAHFPRIPVFDPLIDFPRGAVGIWPPLFDVALALPARVLHGAAATREQIASTASVTIPVLGALAVLAAAFFGGAVRRGAAIPAALFVALCGAHVHYSQYGHTDQHVAESLTSLLALAFFLRARARPGTGREALAGAMLGIAALTWQGAICWAALYALVLALDDLRRPRGEVFRAAAVIFGSAAVVDAAGVAYWVRGEAVPFTFISFGAFQPVFLAAMAGGVIAIDAVLGMLRKDPPRSFGKHAAALAVLAGVLRGRIPDLVRNLTGGIGYVTRTSRGAAGPGGLTSFPREMLHLVFEARPLLADGVRVAFDTLSLAFFLIPVAIFVWIARAWHGPRLSEHLALSGWAVLTLWLALSQRLNIYYAAPLAALAGWEVARQIGTRASRAWAPAASSRRVASRVRAGVALALLITALPGLKRQLSTRYAPGDDLIATMEWARTHLDHAVAAYDPRFLPPGSPVPELDRAEAMLSPWALGHFVTFYAELPAPADGFGYGFMDSIRFFLAETEGEALAIARDRRSRWIAATDLTPRMNDYARILGRAPYLSIEGNRAALTPAYFRTMQSRLYDFDGGGPAPLAHFRLVHASRSGSLRGGHFVAGWKIFEIR
jgi:asparagine N-glycosylation enzyme membrane subunit Stt3